MNSFPQSLQSHLQGEVTSICRCWILETGDGQRLGFTDHDEDLQVNGVLCERFSGMESSAIEERLGLNIDTHEVSGALSSDKLTDRAIEAGIYDNARLFSYLVNWNDATDAFLERVNIIGKITREDHAYRIELMGLTAPYDQSRGRTFIRKCQADLGGNKCRVDLSRSQYHGVGTVVSVVENGVLEVSGLEMFANGFFRGGQIIWQSGSNVNRGMEILDHGKTTTKTQLSLWQPMPDTPQAGDTFKITAGCDKSFATCKSQFANGLNFQGFPHMPGNTIITDHAGNNEIFDGSPLIP